MIMTQMFIFLFLVLYIVMVQHTVVMLVFVTFYTKQKAKTMS